jgi:hypothetical protein
LGFGDGHSHVLRIIHGDYSKYSLRGCAGECNGGLVSKGSAGGEVEADVRFTKM